MIAPQHSVIIEQILEEKQQSQNWQFVLMTGRPYIREAMEKAVERCLNIPLSSSTVEQRPHKPEAGAFNSTESDNGQQTQTCQEKLIAPISEGESRDIHLERLADSKFGQDKTADTHNPTTELNNEAHQFSGSKGQADEGLGLGDAVNHVRQDEASQETTLNGQQTGERVGLKLPSLLHPSHERTREATSLLRAPETERSSRRAELGSSVDSTTSKQGEEQHHEVENSGSQNRPVLYSANAQEATSLGNN